MAMTMATTSAPSAQVLRKKANWRTLHFYQKADTLYQLTVVFASDFYRLTATALWIR